MARLKLGIAVVGVLLLAAAPVFAAGVDGPMFLSSDPEAGEEFHKPPPRVEIAFSEPLDKSSEIRIFDECERRIDDGLTAITANEMSVGIQLTPVGTYTVRYSASGPGGLTGETNGSFTFIVHAGKSCGGGGGHPAGHDPGGKGPSHGGGGKHGSNGGHKGDGPGHEGDSGDHSSSGDHSKSGGVHPSGSSGNHPGSGSHSPGSGDNHRSGEHGSSSGGGHGSKGGSQSHGRGHGGGSGTTQASGGTGDFAAGDGGPAPLAGVEGSAVLMALGAALVMGAGGGWIIRSNNLA